MAYAVLIIQFDNATQIHCLLLISMPKLVVVAAVAEHTKSLPNGDTSQEPNIRKQIQKLPNRRLLRPVGNPVLDPTRSSLSACCTEGVRDRDLIWLYQS